MRLSLKAWGSRQVKVQLSGWRDREDCETVHAVLCWNTPTQNTHTRALARKYTHSHCLLESIGQTLTVV